LKTSAAGIAFIQRWEGTKLTAYKDTGGVWTIGTGHAGSDVRPGMTITAERARELLEADVVEAEEVISRRVKVPLSQRQFDTLVSFVFNIGEPQFKTSTLLRTLNNLNYIGVPAQLVRWVYDNGRKIDGLVARRAAEVEMWNTGASVAAPQHPPEQTSTIPTAPTPARKPAQGPLSTTGAPPLTPRAAWPWVLAGLALVGIFVAIFH
jgi:lysozyme